MKCPVIGCEAEAVASVDNLRLCGPHAAALVVGARLISECRPDTTGWRWLIGE